MTIKNDFPLVYTTWHLASCVLSKVGSILLYTYRAVPRAFMDRYQPPAQINYTKRSQEQVPFIFSLHERIWVLV